MRRIPGSIFWLLVFAWSANPISPVLASQPKQDHGLAGVGEEAKVLAADPGGSQQRLALGPVGGTANFGDVQKPLYADPNYRGSCDPEIVWNKAHQKISFLQVAELKLENGVLKCDRDAHLDLPQAMGRLGSSGR